MFIALLNFEFKPPGTVGEQGEHGDAKTVEKVVAANKRSVIFATQTRNLKFITSLSAKTISAKNNLF